MWRLFAMLVQRMRSWYTCWFDRNRCCLADYTPGAPWLASRSSARAADCLTRDYKVENNQDNASTMRWYCPSSRSSYGVTISTIILHIWSRAQTDSEREQGEERDYRWEHNVITGRNSDKKADDLAQWAPHHLVIDFFERKIVKSWRTP